LIPGLLENTYPRPRTVFTIHNLAYGGHFSHAIYEQLQLPWHWWSSEGVEFYGGFSMLKAGISYADAVTTVSPTYAKEICTPEFGYGLDGLLRSRSYKLSGILNGIDTEIWNPKHDQYLAENYGLREVRKGKLANKKALLERFGQTPTEEQLAQPLLGMVSRLVEQKGVDMIMECMHPILAETNAAFVIIGSGHYHYERALSDLAERYPGRVMVYIGYNEELAHLLEAGSDIFLMPSRFEPCGLNQMYSLNYGTLPVVYHTGGLADTVINATTENLEADTANGFVFYLPFSHALLGTLWWVLRLFADDSKTWRALQRNAIKADFAWKKSAKRYLELYRNN
jgi:starch synthase